MKLLPFFVVVACVDQTVAVPLGGSCLDEQVELGPNDTYAGFDSPAEITNSLDGSSQTVAGWPVSWHTQTDPAEASGVGFTYCDGRQRLLIVGATALTDSEGSELSGHVGAFDYGLEQLTFDGDGSPGPVLAAWLQTQAEQALNQSLPLPWRYGVVFEEVEGKAYMTAYFPDPTAEGGMLQVGHVDVEVFERPYSAAGPG